MKIIKKTINSLIAYLKAKFKTKKNKRKDNYPMW